MDAAGRENGIVFQEPWCGAQSHRVDLFLTLETENPTADNVPQSLERSDFTFSSR